MIIKTDKKEVTVFYVEKDYPDEQLNNVLNSRLQRKDIDTIIEEDADVYTTDGKLLLRFRKNKLNPKNISQFYENIIQFAMKPTSNRGSAFGSKSKNVYDNPKQLTNIIGYFDKFSPSQKRLLREQNKHIPVTARETRFNIDYPEKYKKVVPLVKEIDHFYKKYAPDQYRHQRKKADQTPFKISGTAFTTVTTNVNFQTTVHTDKGDDEDGFGNLAVIEKGKYSGGEICFPQYGIGVDVRTGDILYMDVHEAHGNLPIVLEDPDAKRLSIVCYLRKNIWEQTKHKTKRFMLQHNKTVKGLRKQS